MVHPASVPHHVDSWGCSPSFLAGSPLSSPGSLADVSAASAAAQSAELHAWSVRLRAAAAGADQVAMAVRRRVADAGLVGPAGDALLQLAERVSGQISCAAQSAGEAADRCLEAAARCAR